MNELDQLPPFNRYLVMLLANRAREANDPSRMFTLHNRFYQIVLGTQPLTPEDFELLGSYLDTSSEQLRAVYEGYQAVDYNDQNSFRVPHLGGG